MCIRDSVYTALMGYTDFSDAKKLAKEFSSDVFRVSGLKGFLDGVTSVSYTHLVQLVEHTSLDQIREAIIAQLEEEGYVDGENIEIDYQNRCV